jgi:hypothetical protein
VLDELAQEAEERLKQQQKTQGKRGKSNGSSSSP